MRKGIYDLYSTASYEAYKGSNELKNEFLEEIGQYAWDSCKSLACSKYQKKKRIKTRFQTSVKRGLTVFVTLTFTDSVLNTTSKDTRRQYVRKFLKKYCAHYVANIDYGSNTHREHYHALVKVKGDKLRAEDWKYGFSWFAAVPGTDSEAVSEYVAKLSNHALKTSCRMPRLIWSRGWKQQREADICYIVGKALKEALLRGEKNGL